MNFEILKTWTIPYPGCEPSQIRQKEFNIVRLKDGNLAFCKVDTAPEYLAHEAEILSGLNDLDCVPLLIYQTPTAIFTTYIKGKLLPEIMDSLGVAECIKVGWQILAIVARVHKKGVIHSDIRSWNFIYGDDTHLYIIDFEYAYFKYQQSEVDSLLRVHHGENLKTPFLDWIDAWKCIVNVWQISTHRIIKNVLVYIPISIHWGMRRIMRLLRKF